MYTYIYIYMYVYIYIYSGQSRLAVGKGFPSYR